MLLIRKLLQYSTCATGEKGKEGVRFRGVQGSGFRLERFGLEGFRVQMGLDKRGSALRLEGFGLEGNIYCIDFSGLFFS